MEIKGVVFDLDGLLVDTEKTSYNSYKELLKEYGIEFPLTEYVQKYSGSTCEANVERLIQNYHLPLAFDEVLQREQKMELDQIRKGVDLKPGAIQLLQYLKQNNYKMSIASSSSHVRAFTILDQHGLRDFFDVFVLSEDVERSKPDPDVFLKSSKKLNLPKENCLVLEDSENGVLAALNANMPVICIPDLKRPAEPILNRASSVCTSLEEVISFLEK